MFRKQMNFFVVLVLCLWISSPIAEIVDLTRTSILVENTDSNDPIKLKQAFAQILAKNTGEKLNDIVQNPAFVHANIKSGIKRSYFEKIDSQFLSKDSPYRFWFHVVVQESFIKGIIQEAGFSLLTINRDKIMLWMVQEKQKDGLLPEIEELNIQAVLDYAQNDVVLKYWVDHWAQALGLIIVYPRLDELDRELVTPKSIKNLSFQPIDQSKIRYDIQHIVMLYVKKSIENLRIRSGYVNDGEDVIIKHYQEPIFDVGSVVYAVMVDIAENFSLSFRIDSSDLLKHNVRMQINSLVNYDEVMRVEHYLSTLSVIEGFDLVAASNGQLSLNVNLLIRTAAFLKIIERDKVLSYQQDSPINQLVFNLIKL